MNFYFLSTPKYEEVVYLLKIIFISWSSLQRDGALSQNKLLSPRSLEWRNKSASCPVGFIQEFIQDGLNNAAYNISNVVDVGGEFVEVHLRGLFWGLIGCSFLSFHSLCRQCSLPTYFGWKYPPIEVENLHSKHILFYLKAHCGCV